MPEPRTLTLPARIAERVPLDKLRDAEDDPYRLSESPQEAQGRRSMARETRVAVWRARTPARFHEADVGRLTPEQDPDGAVSNWLNRGYSKTLLLRSTEPGVGKTYAAYAVGLHGVATWGMWAQAWSMVDLNDAFRPGNDPTAYVVAQECDLLVLDDVGRERITEWTLERLQGVIDARWRDRRFTVLTTNLTPAEFERRYGDPIMDRILDGVTAVEITGKTRRDLA